MSKNEEKEIYFKYADEMFSLCYRYIGNLETAEELLNDGFIKVFKNLRKFKPQRENSLKFWIRKIMVNECLMYLRKKKKISTQWIENFNEIEINNYTPDARHEIVEGGSIDNLIQQLPFGYRTIFNLFAIEGYSHKEISEKLKISESTSRSQLTMARNKLKELLLKKGLTYGK